ncbi:MAG TPA: glycosyltransferase family 87 protein [bacterium]|nr:glycosyltransferase family 87 protein [bacterium]
MKKIFRPQIFVAVLLSVIVFFIYFRGLSEVQSKEKDLFFEDFYAQYEAAKDYKVFFRPYPPTASLIYLPFTKINYRTAATIFCALNIAVLILCAFIAGKLSGIKKLYDWNLLVLFCIFFIPFYYSIIYGQINIFILLILLCVIKIDVLPALKKGLKNLIIGFLIAFGTVIKIFPVFLLFLFLIKKRFSVLVAFIGFTIFFIMIYGLIYDWETLIYYIKYVVPVTSKSWVILTVNNQSLLSLITRLFGHTLESGNAALIYFPLIIKPLYFFTAALLLFINFYFVKKTDDALLQYSIIILNGILIFGLNWHHTFAFVFFPLIYLLYYYNSVKTGGILNYILWTVGFILIVMKIDYSQYNIREGLHFLTLTAYLGSIVILSQYYRIINRNAR